MLLSGLLICLSSNIKLHICGMVLLCIGAVIASNFDLMHPYCWFSIAFTLYSVSYPIIYLIGFYGNRYGYSGDLMLLQWIALAVFLVFVSPKKKRKINNFKINKISTFTEILYILLYMYICFAIIGIINGGFATKGEIYATGNIFYKVAFRAAIMLTVIYAYMLVQKCICKSKFDIKLVILTGLILCLLTIFSGERDIGFKYIIITLLIAYRFKYIRNIHIVLLAPLFILLLVLSKKYKYYFLGGSLGVDSITINNIFYHFLTSEFSSASRNLQILLNHKTFTQGLFKGFSFINAPLRSFFVDTGSGCVNWFKDTFFESSLIGPGFTLVGEGYINIGYLGVILLFIIIAIFIKYLYKKSNENIYWLVIYIYSIPLYIYAIRADLSNILSPFVKHLLLTIGIIYLFQWSTRYFKAQQENRSIKTNDRN